MPLTPDEDARRCRTGVVLDGDSDGQVRPQQVHNSDCCVYLSCLSGARASASDLPGALPRDWSDYEDDLTYTLRLSRGH